VRASNAAFRSKSKSKSCGAAPRQAKPSPSPASLAGTRAKIDRRMVTFLPPIIQILQERAAFVPRHSRTAVLERPADRRTRTAFLLRYRTAVAAEPPAQARN